MHYALIVESTAYFLSLINPASKIFLLSTMDSPYSWKEVWSVALRSTLIALLIFIVGLTAVRRGRFYEDTAMRSVSGISVVPMAAPLIAGPATITAGIYF